MIPIFEETVQKSGVTLEICERKMTAIERIIIKATNNPDVLADPANCPPDIAEGANEMLVWSCTTAQKVRSGVKSESLSRHTVTYADNGGEPSKWGYPVAMMGFIRPYMRPRF